MENTGADSISTLSEFQWKALRDYGFCTTSSYQHNHLPEYFRNKTPFWAYRNGLIGEFLVEIVSVQYKDSPAGPYDTFILRKLKEENIKRG